MKKTLFITLIITLVTNSIFAQELYHSYKHWSENSPEIVDWEFKISKKIKKDAYKRTNYSKSADLYSYLNAEDFLIIGDHDRVSVAIYDKNLNWYETQLYFYEEMPGKSKKEFNEVAPEIKKIILNKGYETDEFFDFTKIINSKGYWYETFALKENKDAVFIISSDLKLVRIDTESVLSRELFKSYKSWKGDEIVDWEYKISEELKKDVLKRTHYLPSVDLYSYLDSEGYISIGDHDRVSIAIYDIEQNWLETQIWYEEEFYSVSDEQKLKEEYNIVKPKIEKIFTDNNYDMPEHFFYRKIINPKGYWYETSVNKDNKWYKLIINKDFELVKKEISD